jgi:decaprenylphospho-beta-D-erythro-pentofuranosid-2-ulose 2-reductase
MRHHKNVLIVGATSDIAREVAREHARRGDRLFLLGRDPVKLQGVAAELGACVAGVASADFNHTYGNSGLLERAVAALGGLDVAVIAHGWLGDQLVSEASYAHAEEVIRTNFTSAVSLIIPIVNQLESQKHGALVVLSSVAGDRGRPRNYTYGAAKGATTLYLQGVRSRLYGTGVRVVTVRLGPVNTKMTTDHPKNVLFGEAPAVARAIVRSEDRGPEDVYVPWYWRPIMAAVRGLPERVFQRFSFLAGR